MRGLSIIIQVLSFVMVVYLTYFKLEFTNKDILKCIFFMGIYVVEDVRQLKYYIEDINNKNNRLNN
jgi:riboflavin transporter FmnP